MIEVVHPMCQIEGKCIAPEHCQQLQKTCKVDDCFGCGSQYRLCAVCRSDAVSFPEVEFCYVCLQTALQNEQAQALIEGQGKKCARCQLRPVRYSQYGFCLCCTVSAFGPETTDFRKNDMSRDVFEDLYKKAVEYTNQREELVGQELADALDVELQMARKLMQKMEQEGVVGPHRGRWPRYVLKNRDKLAEPSKASPGRALSRILSPTSLSKKVIDQEIASLTPMDRQLVSLGLAFLQQHLEGLADKLKQ